MRARAGWRYYDDVGDYVYIDPAEEERRKEPCMDCGKPRCQTTHHRCKECANKQALESYERARLNKKEW